MRCHTREVSNSKEKETLFLKGDIAIVMRDLNVKVRYVLSPCLDIWLENMVVTVATMARGLKLFATSTTSSLTIHCSTI